MPSVRSLPCASTLLLVSLLAATPRASAQDDGAPPANASSAEVDWQGGLGGTPTDPFAPPVVSQGLGGTPGTFFYQLNSPLRRWKEDIAVVRPDPNLGFPLPYPVLTLFHGFGETPQSVLVNTTLDDEAVARGWLVVVPLGAHPYNYGIDYAQDNIEDVFAFVQTLAPMDMDRIYAVGFSMGGGAAASYAARHIDPQRVRFAALVNHTGSTSLRDTYLSASLQSLFQSPLMFGAVPARAPFRYLRSSVIDLKPGNLVDPETDMVRNLKHVPVIHYSAANEPLQYLVAQSRAAHDRLLHWGGTSEWRVVPGAVHTWASIDPNTVLNVLQAYRLTPPQANTTVPILADRNGRWHAFTLEQSRSKQLSSFTARWDPAQNELWLDELENVGTIGFDVADVTLGLTSAQTLHLHVATRTLYPVEIRVHGFSAVPSALDRNGTPGTGWTWDAQTSTLRIFEGDAVLGAHWSLRP